MYSHLTDECRLQLWFSANFLLQVKEIHVYMYMYNMYFSCCACI